MKFSNIIKSLFHINKSLFQYFNFSILFQFYNNLYVTILIITSNRTMLKLSFDNKENFIHNSIYMI